MPPGAPPRGWSSLRVPIGHPSAPRVTSSRTACAAGNTGSLKNFGLSTNASPSARVLRELANETAGPGPGRPSTTLGAGRGSNARQAAVLGHCVRHRYRHQPAPRRAFAPARSSIVDHRSFAGELASSALR